MAYTICVAVGIALAMLVRRAVPPARHPHRGPILAIAALGAFGGALACEAPADWLGWTASIAGEPVHPHSLGGRTVLGGLLGGWIAVELGKRALGVRVATGDGFAAPLAVALACGRMGCALTGCCAGRPLRDGAWWTAVAVAGVDGVPRFPAQWAEAAFHAVAAVVLVALARKGALEGRRFAAYVSVYCGVRIALEAVRDNPPVLGPFTYYQLLAVPLLALAAGTWAWRGIAPCGTSAVRRAARRNRPASA